MEKSQITFKISKEKRSKFKILCEQFNTNMSNELKKHIENCISDQTLLTDKENQ